MIAAALVLALGSNAGAQGAEQYTFRMLLGRDTLTSEVVQRTPTHVDVDMIDKSTGAHRQYGLTLAPDGQANGDEGSAGVPRPGDGARAEHTSPSCLSSLRPGVSATCRNGSVRNSSRRSRW